MSEHPWTVEQYLHARKQHERLESENRRLREDVEQWKRTASINLDGVTASHERIVALEAENDRMRRAIRETLCDDEPCPRCRYLRAVTLRTTGQLDR